MTTTALRLPLDVDDHADRRALDALTARAIRLALDPRPGGEAATELCAVAHRSTRLLDAAIARLDRDLAAEWSRTVTQAVADLRAARARLDPSGRRRPLPPGAASPRTAS